LVCGLLFLSGCTQISVIDFKSWSGKDSVSKTAKQSVPPCTQDILGKDLYKLGLLVRDSRGMSKWPPNHDLSAGFANIVINTPEGIALFSNTNNQKTGLDFYRAMGHQTDKGASLACLGRAGDLNQAAAWIKSRPRRTVSEPLDFLFVYAGSNGSQWRGGRDLNAAANVIGKFLYIEVGILDKTALVEIQRTIIHEGVHFFGQSNILISAPKVSDVGSSSRELLIAEYRENDDFRLSVHRELCIGREILDKVFAESKPTKSEIRSLLVHMVGIANDRRDGSRIDVKEAEKFWYLVEGIPQYMDQQILIKNGSASDIGHSYRIYCTSMQSPVDGFYPLLAGAALSHGLDFVLGSRDAWQNSAKFDVTGPNNWSIFLTNLER